jgi:thiamine-phosphate pyrophosphorylase
MNIKGYYFITDSKLTKSGNSSDIKNAIDAGVRIVQYRNKTGTTRQMYDEAMELMKLCLHGTLFVVNDRVDIALVVDADGVHIGQDDLPYKTARKLLGKNKIIGVTVHNVEEAVEAQKNGADYIGLSPIFSTSTKTDAGKPAGPGLITEIKKNVRIPVVAIGGITLDNAARVIDAGADAICSISAVVTKPDVKSEIAKFQQLFNQPQNNH